MRGLVSLIDRVTGSVGLVGAWLVAPLVIATCYEVFARYVLQEPTVWAYELGYMLTGANFLLGMALALREGSHIRVDVLYGRFSARTRALVNAFSYVAIVIPCCAWLALALFHHALAGYASGETSGQSAWNPVVWPFRVSFFVAFAVLALQGVAELWKCLEVLRRTEEGAAVGALRPQGGR